MRNSINAHQPSGQKPDRVSVVGVDTEEEVVEVFCTVRLLDVLKTSVLVHTGSIFVGEPEPNLNFGG
ncbi:hypothetical protein [Paraburkholderia phosphatilytica]|uniref:hypothetical protein n=1 Tax=Paraburkholderia phosphatilytica TaxID=2282883 RepID=UPI003B830E7C